MRIDFKGKTVWVTGASSGIGEQLCLQLNALGANVIASARRKEKLELLRSKCPNKDNLFLIPLDITDSVNLEMAVDQVKNHGKLDLLIHNAGIAQKGLVIDNSLETDRVIMETNYFGTVALTKMVLPIFQEQGYGWFAVVTSIAGVVGVPGRSSYSASKHALHGFFDSLRAEEMNCTIDVSIIMPGFINTHITVKELKGDGTPYGKVEKSHQQGMSPERCARKIIRGLSRKRRNIIVGGTEIIIVYIKRISPRLYDFIVRNHPVRRLRRFRARFRSE